MEFQGLDNKIKKILQAALSSVDPYNLIKQQFICHKGILTLPAGKKIDLRVYSRIFICGAGKGVAPMCKALEELLGDRLYQGKIIVKYDHLVDLNKTDIYQAAHPVPDANALIATGKMIEGLRGLNENDLVFVLLTGGGSALMELLADDITLNDLQEMNKILLRSGATIHEINCIRKHISKIKGGQLAKIIQPATCITFALSDVIGDDLSVIASGPTFPDNTLFADAMAIINKYGILAQLPEEIIHYLNEGIKGRVAETPKESDKIFRSVTNLVVGNNKLALECARKEAQSLGFNALIITSMLQGEAREIARVLAAVIREIQMSDMPLKKPACLLLGGEPTVTIKGGGKGGRNQELALALALTEIKEPYIFLSCGSDGTDGPTDAAGAVVTHHTIERAKKNNLDGQQFLTNNDSYHFFKSLNNLIITGPTKTNVMDIIIGLIP
jgi:glycerate 2-kinase